MKKDSGAVIRGLCYALCGAALVISAPSSQSQQIVSALIADEPGIV